MEQINEIKKILYREKPYAVFVKASQFRLIYRTTINVGGEDETFFFHIPIDDIGDAFFEQFMPAQQLIRWLVMSLINPETQAQ